MKNNRTIRIILATISILALAGLIFGAAWTAKAAGVVYVRTDGSDANCDGTVDAAYPGSGGPGLACAVQTIQAGIDLVDPGGTVFVRTGTYVLSTVVNVNKSDITLDGDGAGATIVQVSGTGERITITAPGVTLQDFEILKTDKTGVQNIIGLANGNNVTIKNNTIHGQFVIGDGDVSRAIVIYAGSFSGVNIEGNTIYGLRQPAYISGTHSGTIQNNYVYRTKGWVLEGGNLAFNGNTWGTGADVNVYDIAILANVGAGPYPDIVAMSNANNGAVIEDQRVSPAVLSVVYVDAATSYASDLGGRFHPYSTITPALTRVVAGGTIHVAAGTYVEDLTIEKAMTLLGPNAAINPNTGVRLAEAVVLPAVSAPDPAVCEVMTYLKVSNVTIKGFTFDGDNPSLTSGVMIDGADVDACEILAGYEGMGNIVVENNILKHSTYTGIDFYNYTNTAATAGNYIRYNRLEDIGETTYNWGIGILIYNNFYAEITDNVLTGVRTGVQTGNFSQANPGTTASISNNQIGVWRLGIFHNLAYSSASSFTISGNTFTAEAYPGATKWNGLLLSSIDTPVSAVITGNTINIPDPVAAGLPDYSAGYNVWNVKTTAPIAISGGTVTGGDYGIFVNNFEGYNSNADNTAITIDGVTILGSDVAGVYVKDSPSNTNGATVYANIQNSVVDSDATGILVEGSDATAKANNNKIVGNPTAGITNTGVAMMDAERNWWGCPCGPGAPGDSVSANVDYTPWWADEAMTTLGPGPGGELIVPTGATTAQAQAILDCAAGKTVVFEGGAYPGGLVINVNAVTVKINSSTIGHGSPAFTVNSDDVTLLGPGVLDGAGDMSSAILVNSGADNLIVDGLEIKNWENGILNLGAHESLKVVNNWIHDNSGQGLEFGGDVVLTGVVTIQGNLFKANGANGVLNQSGQLINVTYNSWGDVGGPAGPAGDGATGPLTVSPWTFSEVFVDVKPDTLAAVVDVNEGAVFNVAVKVEAANLYAVQYMLNYDPAFLTFQSISDGSFKSATGSCTNNTLTPGVISVYCTRFSPASEVNNPGGETISTISFLASNSLVGNGPWSTSLDLSTAAADLSTGAKGGIKVFVNNGGFGAPSVPARDITDADDGEVIIHGLANFTGYIDLEGRANDSGATINIWNQMDKAGALEYARGLSVSSGKYTTAHLSPYWLNIPTTYYFQVDAPLFLPTTAMASSPTYPVVPTTWWNGDVMDTRPLQTLLLVKLLGGDANDNNTIDTSDLGCIGGAYGGAPAVCGAGTSDVNGDGKVDIYDLVLTGGNYDKTFSAWAQVP